MTNETTVKPLRRKKTALPFPDMWPAGLAELVELGAHKGHFVYSDEAGGLFATTYRHSGPWFGVNAGHLPWQEAQALLRGALGSVPHVKKARADEVRANAIKVGEKR